VNFTREQYEEIEKIGADSWMLLNTKQLSIHASKVRILEALKSDKEWLENHTQEIVGRIEELMQEVEHGEE